MTQESTSVMHSATPRVVNAVSTVELHRRWKAVRSQMSRFGIDALVLQNSSDWVGGYIRWFTNQPATNGYPSSVIFPLDGGMSVIEQGPFGELRECAAEQLEATGIARRLTTPSYPSVGYTGAYDAQLAVAELQRIGAKCIGLVAPASMYHSFGQALSDGLTAAQVVDATDWVDRIKAIKSAEERTFIRAVAEMQDQVMEKVRDFIQPGMRDFQVASYAQYVGQQLGSEQGVFLCSSAPWGHAASFQRRSMQGRTIQPNDVFSLLIENNGAGGYYTELSRIFVLGRAPQALLDAHAAVIEAQRYALSLLKPGAFCKDIFAEHNAYLHRQGLAEERRLSVHGMGYDMVERPLIRHDEDMAIAEHMAIVCHPGILNDRMFIHNTDVYFIEANGPSRCLHATPKQIFEKP